MKTVDKEIFKKTFEFFKKLETFRENLVTAYMKKLKRA